MRAAKRRRTPYIGQHLPVAFRRGCMPAGRYVDGPSSIGPVSVPRPALMLHRARPLIGLLPRRACQPQPLGPRVGAYCPSFAGLLSLPLSRMVCREQHDKVPHPPPAVDAPLIPTRDKELIADGTRWIASSTTNDSRISRVACPSVRQSHRAGWRSS